jgi:hypothetical protein
MRQILIAAWIGIFFSNCAEQKITHCISETCPFEATVIDLRSLDGCDFVFELKDGTRLIPERRIYVRAPEKEADPVYYYQFVNGARVTIGFNESSSLSSCMAGQMVYITCITEMDKG